MIAAKMTWVSVQKRWIKGYGGKTYSVSCKQLNVQATKEQSIHAANQWWARKQAELELTEKANRHSRSEEIIEAMQANVGTIETTQDAMRTLLGFIEAGTLPDWLSTAILGQKRIEGLQAGYERLVGVKKAEEGRTIRGQVDKWLTFLRGQVGLSQLNAGRYGAYAQSIEIFASWCGEDEDINVITADRLEAYHAYLASEVAGGRWATATANGHLMAAKQFISRLSEHGLIPVPGNMKNRRLRFTIEAKTVKRFTIEEVRSLLESAQDKTKLYILLMLNCGMTQNDIAELGKEEVDWEEGSIRRPRSKTPNGPTVRYKLWAETFALLKRFKATADVPNERRGNRCLLTGLNNPLVWQRIKDGKTTRCDCIRTALRFTQEKTGITKPAKLFRKTSASELASSPHASLVDIFLCHTPRSIAEKHYVKLTDTALDEAMNYLHGRYFG